MNRSQFADLVHSFMAHTRPGRHLYIWHGDEKDLLALLPQPYVHRLSLFESLVGLSDVSSADSNARSQLNRLITVKLNEIFAKDTGDPKILVVTGTLLLARYGGANIFFDFVNDHQMVILQISSSSVDTETQSHLPEYVQFRPMVEMEVLKQILERPANLVTEELQ